MASTERRTNEEPPAPASEARELARACATSLLEVSPQLAAAMAKHMHEEHPELGGVEDEKALGATCRSWEANLREIFILVRAGLPVSTQETPAEVREYARFMRRRGVGLGAVLDSYEIALVMLRQVIAEELERAAGGDDRVESALDALNEFVFAGVQRAAARVAAGYENRGYDWQPRVDDSQQQQPSSEAVEHFIAEHGDRSDGQEDASARAKRVLDEFCSAVESASGDERVSWALALADTTVRITLLDEDELGVTLLLDRKPIEVDSDDDGEAEVRIAMLSSDLERLDSEDFSLPIAIGKGRANAQGPVRRFLRVVPTLRRALYDARADAEGDDGRGAAVRDQRDQEADESHIHGALEVDEESPGTYWSVQCLDVHKSYGSREVLKGVNLGIPEGMITVILGPSGVGKTVLLKHLIGLEFPDEGDVLVHGRSLSERRRSELLDMRRRFGMLFQDGALFGSMNLYDNVAFPLREHTNKSEKEIREIVMSRLEDVGLADDAEKSPDALSGGMRKRAGFARALVLEPEIVMFDEPDSGLDPVRTALLSEVIREVHAEHGGTYIVVTHDTASAQRMGEYTVLLWGGQVVQAGERDEMFNSDNPFVRQFLTGDPEGPLGMG